LQSVRRCRLNVHEAIAVLRVDDGTADDRDLKVDDSANKNGSAADHATVVAQEKPRFSIFTPTTFYVFFKLLLVKIKKIKNIIIKNMRKKLNHDASKID
jgi:hypothetical protein